MNAEYLIDDSARHFVGFSGIGVLYTAPHNVKDPADIRVDNWQQVLRFFTVGLSTEAHSQASQEASAVESSI